MAYKLYKFNTEELNEIDNITLALSNANALIISNIADMTKSYSNTLTFTITSGNNHVPYLEDTEIMVVVREKVDLTAHGPNPVENTTSDKNKRPYRPVNLPQGFIELKGENL